jgi:uncharacterized protein DUF6559
MGLLDRWRLRRAAKRYARSLGPALVAAFGASEFYTPPQIRTAVSRNGLDARFLALAYAAFLPEAQFDAMKQDMPRPLAYAEARALLERYRPSQVFSASGEAPESAYVTAGPWTGGGSSH